MFTKCKHAKLSVTHALLLVTGLLIAGITFINVDQYTTTIPGKSSVERYEVAGPFEGEGGGG